MDGPCLSPLLVEKQTAVLEVLSPLLIRTTSVYILRVEEVGHLPLPRACDTTCVTGCAVTKGGAVECQSLILKYERYLFFLPHNVPGHYFSLVSSAVLPASLGVPSSLSCILWVSVKLAVA